MSSSKEYPDFILNQLAVLDEIPFKPIMGEYPIYYRGKIIGGIYLATLRGGFIFGKVCPFAPDRETDAIVPKAELELHPQALTTSERLERSIYLRADKDRICVNLCTKKESSDPFPASIITCGRILWFIRTFILSTEQLMPESQR